MLSKMAYEMIWTVNQDDIMDEKKCWKFELCRPYSYKLALHTFFSHCRLPLSPSNAFAFISHPSLLLQNSPPQLLYFDWREREIQKEQMSKRFKLRIARVLPSFHSCRSQDVVPMPSISAPSASSGSSLIKRHVSSALVSVGCRFRSSSSSSSSSSKSNRPEVAAAAAPDPTPTSDFQWQKDEKWHVIAKVPAHHRRRKISSHLSSSSSSDDEYFSKHNAKERGGKTRARKKPKKKKKILRRKKSFVHRSSLRLSSSSLDNYCWFSSSERECGFIHDEFLETRTLVSSNSRSFSSSSSDGGKEEANPATRRKELRLRCPSPETESPARMSVFRRMVGCGGREEGKVKESFAVVKRSEDPYGDFRRSMLEMIVEKEMYEKEDLEQLLHCFLSLNSRSHHAVIVQAFSEIWETLFSGGRQV